MRSYVVPVKEVKGILQPTTLKVKNEGLKNFKIKNVSSCVVNFIDLSEESVQKVKRKTKKKS